MSVEAKEAKRERKVLLHALLFPHMYVALA